MMMVFEPELQSHDLVPISDRGLGPLALPFKFYVKLHFSLKHFYSLDSSGITVVSQLLRRLEFTVKQLVR